MLHQMPNISMGVNFFFSEFMRKCISKPISNPDSFLQLLLKFRCRRCSSLHRFIGFACTPSLIANRFFPNNHPPTAKECP